MPGLDTWSTGHSYFYILKRGRFKIRKHWLHVTCKYSDYSLDGHYGVHRADPFWDYVDKFCEENFSLFGNGFMHICYHVNRKESFIEFRNKTDAMLFKLQFS